ncbi:MAG: DUF2971 domain-containing protein [Planctomycetes bacterium]|nr:DUF2971 domain-containing protein [Planctomycetota bacterium]
MQMSDSGPKALRQQLVRRWREHHDPVPELLFHYTSASGLLGIVNSQSLHMTELRYMNDSSELRYAEGLVSEAIEGESSRRANEPVARELLRRVSNTFNLFGDGMRIFASSFCENGNLLGQWRSYGEAAGGFAIGFELPRMLPFLQPSCWAYKVIYDPRDQSRLVQEAIEAICDAVGAEESDRGREVSERDSKMLPDYARCTAEIVSEFLIAMKHPDFATEQEWRLVATLAGDPLFEPDENARLGFKTRRGGIVPYCDVSWAQAALLSKDDRWGTPYPISEVVIGPTAADTNADAVLGLLRNANPHYRPRIRKSGTPLRWL